VGRDFRVHYKLGKLYLLLTERRYVDEHRRDTHTLQDRDTIAAIDPGVRKFATIYSPEGKTAILGANANKVVDKCLFRRHRARKKLHKVTGIFKRTKRKLREQKGQETGALGVEKVNGTLRLKKVSVRAVRQKLRNRLWRAKRRYREAEHKTKNVIEDLHYKASHFLLQRFQTLLVPHTSAHHWRKGNRLNKRVKQRSQALSFGKFAQRLIETATWYPGSKIVRGSEAYTSKQCGRCGCLNDHLGGNETFVCEQCSSTADRDIHAARNILLRFMQ
jgi:putative transposase